MPFSEERHGPIEVDAAVDATRSMHGVHLAEQVGRVVEERRCPYPLRVSRFLGIESGEICRPSRHAGDDLGPLDPLVLADADVVEPLGELDRVAGVEIARGPRRIMRRLRWGWGDFEAICFSR